MKTPITASDVAAWWGAITGSLALLWEIFVWLRQGVRLRVTAQANMERLAPGDSADADTKRYVAVTVANIGDQPTTITHVLGETRRGRIGPLFSRSVSSFVAMPMNISGGYSQIPHVLGPGQTWTGLIDQTNLKNNSDAGDLIFCGIAHVMSVKPILKHCDFGKKTA